MPKVKYTNPMNLPILTAAWLAHSDYSNGSEKPEYKDKKVISATSLMRPVKQLVLQERLTGDSEFDVNDFIAAKMGTAIHDHLESFWLDQSKREAGLKALGYSDKAIAKFIVNPTKTQLKDKKVKALYFEKRSFREIDGIVVSGMFDAVIGGQLFDYKSTSAHSLDSDSKAQDYAMQGSIYRYLNPELITGDTINIIFFIMNWDKFRAARDPNYAQTRILMRSYPLLSIEDTEAWIKGRIALFDLNRPKAEEDIAKCSDAEMWIENEYRYFKDPANAKVEGARATRVFKSKDMATKHLNTAGIGALTVKVGVPRACRFCPVYALCTDERKLKMKGVQ